MQMIIICVHIYEYGVIVHFGSESEREREEKKTFNLRNYPQLINYERNSINQMFA